MTDSSQAKRVDHRADLAVGLLLALAAGLIFARDITVGGVRWKDGSTHTMDAVLLLDWVQAGPEAWADPLDFALHQYAHYPNLGFMGAFPPGLAAVQWLFFAVFGVSIVSARLVIVLFGIAAAVGCYALARQWCSRWTASLATAFLLSMPIVVEWGRQAMLETPTLAVVVWLLYFAVRYFERPTWRGLVVVAAFVFVAPLFKQNGIFAIPVLALVATYRCWRGRLPLGQLTGGALLIILPLAAYTALSMSVQFSGQIVDRLFNGETPLSEWFSWEQLTFYLASVPRKAGYLVTLLAAVGVVISLRARDWRWALIALSFAAAWALVSVMQHKETRYFYLAYLPIALWGGLTAGTLLQRLRSDAIRATVGTVAVLAALAAGYRTPIEYRPDFAPLVASYASEMRGGIVLVEADRDTCFVLAARAALGPRACMVVRGSKLLYSCSCNLDWDFKSHVSSREDVAKLVDHFAFDLIFIERGNPNGLREVEHLEAELSNSARYDLVASHELTIPCPHAAEPITIDVYRPRNRLARQAREIEIPVPLARRTVRVTLGDAR